ncbi:NAD(P)H-dependent oxidoreductase [Ancylobacter dichloromethanicus]
MKVLIVYAHPEPTSLTRQLVDVTAEALSAAGHTVIHSDLYGMKWKAVYDADDFPVRDNPERLSFIMESGHAYGNGHQTPDVIAEQQKLLAADAVVLQFPLWWYGVPAILKGWIERVYAFGFAYGYQNGSNQFRFGEGILKGKRALVNVQAGGPVADYGPRGINGPIEQLLFPLTHGALFLPWHGRAPDARGLWRGSRFHGGGSRGDQGSMACASRRSIHRHANSLPVAKTAATSPIATPWPTTLRRAKPASTRTLPIWSTHKE